MATRKAVVVKPVAPKKVAKETKEVVHRETPNVRAMDFVPVWQECATAQECNEKFGRFGIWASSFASRLRKMGVNLKHMPRGNGGSGGKRIDVDELNALL